MIERAAHTFAAFAALLETGAAGVVIVLALRCSSWATALRWALGAAVVLVGSLALAYLGSRIYFLPPIKHGSPQMGKLSNSFPSHHALLAAADAALVLLLSRSWRIPFLGCALLIDVALVVAKDHHVIDVVASDIFVILATGGALLIMGTASRHHDKRR